MKKLCSSRNSLLLLETSTQMTYQTSVVLTILSMLLLALLILSGQKTQKSPTSWFILRVCGILIASVTLMHIELPRV